MGIVDRKGAVKWSARNAMILAAAAGAAACMGQKALASQYLVDPNWAGTNGAAGVDNGVSYSGVYTSVAAALGAVATGSGAVPSGASPTNPNVINIEPGIYNFNATIAYSAKNVSLYGLSSNASSVVIEAPLDSDYNAGSSTIGTTNCSVLQLKGNNQTVMNLTIANTTDTPYIVSSHLAEAPNGQFTGNIGSNVQTASAPAVALLTQGDEQVFQNVQILGYQDTLYMKGGRNLYTDVTVSGDNDFIFANGTSVFQNSIINVDGNHAGGCVTAASTDKATSNGIVFINDTIASQSVKNSIIDPQGAAVAGGATAGTMYLGRPWGWQQVGGDASAVYINDEISSAINAAGWITWNNNETNVATQKNAGNALTYKNGGNPGADSRFAEYNSMDLSGNPLNVSSRVSWSHQLSATQAAAYNLAVLGLDGNGNPLTSADVLSNIFKSEYNATTNPNGYAWYGNGYADPSSFPTFWGTRNVNNDTNNDTITGNPSAYSDTNWTQRANDPNWDPFIQLVAVPEPAALSLLGGAAAMLLTRRNRKNDTESK
jgi:pectin methylesterase-like acyl-CoA thioesterase